MGRTGLLLERKIRPGLAHFVAGTFEELCRQWVARMAPGFAPDRVGSWWTGDAEIDVVAYDDRHALFGECKWSEKPMQQADLEKLKAQASRVAALSGHEATFALFSKSGFGRLEHPVMRIGLEEIVAAG
ncbi:MAG: DUF234 domain-containing protein [Armatimonadetes bacterium]|nr:DUF234 domain-containing protein [Armatimonadota bacterium]